MELKKCEEYEKCKYQLSNAFKKLLINLSSDEITYTIEHKLKYIKSTS